MLTLGNPPAICAPARKVQTERETRSEVIVPVSEAERRAAQLAPARVAEVRQARLFTRGHQTICSIS